MIKKLEITLELEVVTGMHIGGTTEFAAIGAIDSPVVRDAISRLPMIPGSSLKGKLRTLMSRQFSDNYMPVSVKNDPDIVKRLFGSSQDENKSYRNARLQFSDSVLSNYDEIKSRVSRPTEVKFENTINRLTAVANPRQIERVIPGCKFNVSIIYNLNNDDEITEDFKALGIGLKLLEYDYIGGSGTRGYGKVKFRNPNIKAVIGEVDEALINKCQEFIGKNI